MIPFLPLPAHGSIEIDGTTLDYVAEGQGTPCLVIGSSLYYPRTFSKALRDHLRLYFVDLRWFAKRYRPVALDSYTLGVLVDDVDRIRRQLRLTKPVLIGHSIHGSIAFEYAKRHPQNVSRLVLIGAPSLLESQEYEEAAAEIWKTASPERQRLQNENWSRLPDFAKHPELQADVENYVAMAPKYWHNPRYNARWLWRGMTINADIFHRLYGVLFANYRMFGPRPEVPVPTFVAQGMFDYIVPHPTWERYRSVPNLTLSLFKKSGHTPQLEEPTLFDRRLLAWLGKGIPLGMATSKSSGRIRE